MLSFEELVDISGVVGMEFLFAKQVGFVLLFLFLVSTSEPDMLKVLELAIIRSTSLSSSDTIRSDIQAFLKQSNSKLCTPQIIYKLVSSLSCKRAPIEKRSKILIMSASLV